MEIRKGYKQTEVGVIPIDWEVKFLSELFTFSGGFTASREELSDNGFCNLQYGDIHNSNKTYIDVSEEYANIPKLDIPISYVSKKSLLNDGDIVFVDASEDDEGASRHIVVRNYRSINYISGLHTIVSKSKDESLDNTYKEYCFQTSDVKKQFKFYAVGIKVSGISKKNIAKIQIPIPPKDEQTPIANALSNADVLISKLEELIAKKRNIKQGAMQELLIGKKRLPGFSGKWEMKKLGEIAIFYSGGTPSTSNPSYYGGNIAWITSSDLNKKKILSVNGKITELGYKNSSAKMIKKNTLLIALYGATAGVTALAYIDAAINQAVLAIIPKFDNVDFLYYKLSNMKADFIKTFTQGGQPNLSGNIVKSFELSMPPLSEQSTIAQVLGDADAEIEQLEQKLEKYRMIKQGMMQELLTGKIRLI